MNRLQKMLLQIALYGAAIIYICADLFLFHGPIHRKIESKNPFTKENIAKAKANGVVARVFNHPITRGQVDRAAHERLWLTGQSYDELDAQGKQLARYAALDELIHHELLRVKAMMNAREAQVDEDELDARIKLFNKRFADEPSRIRAMKSQGINSDQDLRDRIAAHMQQENYVALKIDPLVVVSDAEARAWYAENQHSLGQPERIQARHIFLPSLHTDHSTARQKLESALSQLNQGHSKFATLAKTISQDSATASQGGDLGWMSVDRLPADFGEAIFKLPLHHPTILQSEIGWHLVEVTGRKHAETRSYEQAREEIIAALEAVKRRQAVREFRAALRQFEKDRVTVFKDMME